MKAKIFITIALVVVLFLILNVLETPKDPTPVEITAEELWNDFESDRSTAEAQYDGEKLAVTGTIAEISENFMGQPCVLLENGVDSIPDGIFCFFPEGTDVNTFTCGDSITVIGNCSVSIHLYGEDTPFISIEVSTVN